jgi:benzoylformate decarboxylase
MNLVKGSSAFLTLLESEGVTHLFGNPGTTELPVMDAITSHTELTYVLGMQESLVVAMADGFSRASGRLTACNVHVAPGLGNAMGAIYNAKFTGTPMIITAGQQEQGHGLMEPLLYDPLVPIATPLVKWATEINRLEDMPRIVRRAAKIATTPPTGPVFLSLPGDVLNDQKGIELGLSTRVDSKVRPSDERLDNLASRVINSKSPCMLVGNEVVTSDAFTEISKLAEVLGAAVFQQTTAYGSHYPSEHVCFMGALSRNQKEVRSILSDFDLLIVIGADVLRMSVFSEIDPLPVSMPIVQIGLDDWEIGKNYPAEAAIRADVKETLNALIPIVEMKGGADASSVAQLRLEAISKKNWSSKRHQRTQAALRNKNNVPIDCDWLMLEISNTIPDEAIVVNEGLTTTWNLLNFLPFRDRYNFHSFASGGIGWGLPAAVGVQLAQPERPVVALIGDGSAMYSIQALWTAAKMKLPITFVIANNRGYRIIKQRLLSFHGNNNFIGMDFDEPEIDFVSLATSLGIKSERIINPEQMHESLVSAVESSDPILLDVIVENSV